MKKTKWTVKKIKKEALKYKNRSDFKKYSNGAYCAALRRGILDNICLHMLYSSYPWTDKELKLEALKYNSRGEFCKKNSKAYQAAYKRGILDEICGHMIPSVTEAYTYEELKQEALKYTSKINFIKLSTNHYFAAQRRGWIEKICSHMTKASDVSFAEQELFNYIKKYKPNIKKLRKRKIKMVGKPFVTGFDLDIFDSSTNKGIEFDGKYHHSLEGLKRGHPTWPKNQIKNYHKIKDDYFLDNHNIKVLHIKEEDWLKNKKSCIDKCFRFLEIFND